jgi:hypothetical protein
VSKSTGARQLQPVVGRWNEITRKPGGKCYVFGGDGQTRLVSFQKIQRFRGLFVEIVCDKGLHFQLNIVSIPVVHAIPCSIYPHAQTTDSHSRRGILLHDDQINVSFALRADNALNGVIAFYL